MTKKSEIYGIRSVIEAIKSSNDIDKVFIQKGLKGNLIGQLESLIRKNKINFSYVPVEKLNRLSKKNHQGVIARISPVKFYDLKEIDNFLSNSDNLEVKIVNTDVVLFKGFDKTKNYSESGIINRKSGELVHEITRDINSETSEKDITFYNCKEIKKNV